MSCARRRWLAPSMSRTQRARPSTRLEISTPVDIAASLVPERALSTLAADDRQASVARLAAPRADSRLVHLRHRRPGLTLPRGSHAAAVHELRLAGRLRPGRDPHGCDGRGGHLAPRWRQLRLHPLLLPGEGPGVPAQTRSHRLL